MFKYLASFYDRFMEIKMENMPNLRILQKTYIDAYVIRNIVVKKEAIDKDSGETDKIQQNDIYSKILITMPLAIEL